MAVEDRGGNWILRDGFTGDWDPPNVGGDNRTYVL